MLDQITRRLSILFSSSTPWLVLAVGLSVSVLGDGITNSILAWRDGETLVPSLWLIGFSLLGIIVLLLATDILGRMRNYILANRKQKLIMPTIESEVGRRKGLVVLVSNRPDPPAKFAVAHHAWNLIPGEKPTLKHCWLIAGPGDEEYSSLHNALQLKAELKASKISADICSLNDLTSIEEVYLLTKKAITEAFTQHNFQLEEIIADCTGGTKQMTLGMVLAAAEFGVDLQYLDPNQLKKSGRVEKVAGGVARPINLSFWSKDS
ncbi:MAG: hypothetical protein KC445_15975 [Anaerolineales bacterium]|nr:hypothetical protein [Anaerolineales bacterium]